MSLRQPTILGLTLLAATVVAIACAIYVSLDPKNYYFSLGEDRTTWVYNLRHVLLITGLMLLEAACAAIALLSPRPRRLWLRCLLSLLVLVPWALTITPFVIHMPLYVLVHHMWLWLLVLALVVVALGSVVHRLILYLRQSRLTGRLSGPA